MERLVIRTLANLERARLAMAHLLGRLVAATEEYRVRLRTLAGAGVGNLGVLLREATMSEFGYVAIHTCGHIVAATVDSPDNPSKSRHVASWIRRGEPVERMAIEDVRKADWCQCFRPKPKKKGVAAAPVSERLL